MVAMVAQQNIPHAAKLYTSNGEDEQYCVICMLPQ